MHIGHRLSFDGALCTVRFVGEVENTRGTWLGVEWDDPTRGKHDGTHDGVRYFTCISKQPTAASFIRPTRPADPPRTFLQALRRKYAEIESADHDKSRGGGTVDVGVSAHSHSHSQSHRLRISGKEVEEVGFDKVQAQLADLQHLWVVLLDGMRIGRFSGKEQDISSQDVEAIRESCPEIVELDVGRNLFEKWREVLNIAAQLGKLTSLGAGGNRFNDISIPASLTCENGSAFQAVATLNLDFTLLSWSDICQMATVFPSLTSLSASSNDLSHLGNGDLQKTITTIDLHDNNFENLSDVYSLSKLPHLKILNLKSNNIRSIYSSSSSSSSVEASSKNTPLLSFSPTLTTLDLSFNAINSWHMIDSLPKIFAGLTSLRVSHNPLYQSLSHPDGRYLSPADGYTLTIARMASLSVLNYSPITPRDRLDAEAYYLSLIAAELSHVTDDDARATILSRHPRYSELTSQDGEQPIISSTANHSNTSSSSNTLGANLLTVTFRLSPSTSTSTKPSSSSSSSSIISSNGKNNSNSNVNTTTFTRQIPPSFNVYTVLGIVGRHFGVFPLDLKLFWETGEWVYLPQGRARAKNRNRDDDDDDDDDSAAWNSDEDDEDIDDNKNGSFGFGGPAKHERVPREVEIKAGTRPIGTWIDVDDIGSDDDDDDDGGRRTDVAVAVVRVEVGR